MKIIITTRPYLSTIACAHLVTTVAHMVHANAGNVPTDGSEIPLRLWVNGKEETVGSAFIIGDKKEGV